MHCPCSRRFFASMATRVQASRLSARPQGWARAAFIISFQVARRRWQTRCCPRSTAGLRITYLRHCERHHGLKTPSRQCLILSMPISGPDGGFVSSARLHLAIRATALHAKFETISRDGWTRFPAHSYEAGAVQPQLGRSPRRLLLAFKVPSSLPVPLTIRRHLLAQWPGCATEWQTGDALCP